MNIKEVLENTEVYFKKHGVDQPRLDAEVLLADLLNMERIKLYVKFDYPLTDDELSRYRKRILKRAKHFPIAYITGHKEFMSLDFYVDENVLIPRPETELLVEEIIKICQKKQLDEPNIVDVGPGSGAIMVSLGYYINKAKILGIDISKDAISVLQKNIDRYNLGDRLKVLNGDLLSPLVKRGKSNVDIVISNPPYISEEEMQDLPLDVKQEPEIALKGGKKGIEIYERLIPQAWQVLRSEGLLALEIGYNQGEDITSLLKDKWKEIVVKQDYAGHDRIVLAIKNG